MIKFLPTFILLLATATFSQNIQPTITPTPTPIPTPDGDVVKITTALIQLDLTVTDRKGKVVTDLRADEIEIFENGKKQDLNNFTFISNVRDASVAAKKKIDNNTVIIPPSAVRPKQVRRTIALVVDDLTLSFISTYYVRQALKKFVDEQMQDGDLVAIIRTGAGIGALQQFTNDRRQLYAAIEKVRWNAAGGGNIGAFAPLKEKIQTEPDDAENGGRGPEEIERETNDFRESLFATGTLGAINYIVRGMQDLPGRKSVMLLSDGFKLFTEDSNGNKESGRVLQSLRSLVDMANRASVVIYTMDARGLQTAGFTAEDDTGGRTPTELDQQFSQRRNQLFDTQDGLRYLAQQTGGLAIINNNDLSGGIRKILDDQSYYLIGYEPDDSTFDPKTRRFNKLEIKVKRPDVRVRYRSGFFGVSDEKLVRPAQSNGQRLVLALSSPFAVNDISMRLNALFGNAGKLGSYIRSLVHVKAQDLNFEEQPDGSRKAVFDILAAGFGDNGVVVEQISKTYTMSVKKEAYEKSIKTGFVYEFTIPVKKAGAYQLRVALRDQATNKIGSANQFVEVPDLRKNRLVLSGVALENISFDVWQKRNAGQIVANDLSDPLSDTSLRQFKRGTVLNYGFAIYNAKQAASLTYQTKIFREGTPIFEGKLQPVPAQPAGADPKIARFTGSLSLGTAMLPGDYVLQITVIDNLAKEKQKTAVQFVQFELID